MGSGQVADDVVCWLRCMTADEFVWNMLHIIHCLVSWAYLTVRLISFVISGVKIYELWLL